MSESQKSFYSMQVTQAANRERASFLEQGSVRFLPALFCEYFAPLFQASISRA